MPNCTPSLIASQSRNPRRRTATPVVSLNRARPNVRHTWTPNCPTYFLPIPTRNLLLVSQLKYKQKKRPAVASRPRHVYSIQVVSIANDYGARWILSVKPPPTHLVCAVVCLHAGSIKPILRYPVKVLHEIVMDKKYNPAKCLPAYTELRLANGNILRQGILRTTADHLRQFFSSLPIAGSVAIDAFPKFLDSFQEGKATRVKLP